MGFKIEKLKEFTLFIENINNLTAQVSANHCNYGLNFDQRLPAKINSVADQNKRTALHNFLQHIAVEDMAQKKGQYDK